MERGMTVDQIMTALWRRRSLVCAIAAGVFAIGAAVVATLPSVYQAAVLVRVDSQRPNEELIQHTISERVEQRLLTVRQELLGRPVLERAVQEMGLYPALVKDKGIDAALEVMRKDIDVKVEGENAFELTYRSGDPKLAAQVANRLPVIFAEEALKSRQAQASRATKLFTEEVEALKKSVSDWERKIAQFKVEHMGELPEQIEVNMRGLERVSALMQTKSEELRIAEGRRSDLARAHLAVDSEAGRLQAAEDTLTREEVSARTNWTEDHPELQRIAKEREGLKQKRQEAEGRLVAEKTERARAYAMVAGIQGDMVELQRQAEKYQARLDKTPRWTHELSILNRDYEIAKTKYQSVVSRKVEAELAEGLEARSAKDMFQMVSPAGVPSAPVKPDRLGGLFISMLLALGAGVLAGVVLEMRDDSIRDAEELKEKLPIPVLAVVPNIEQRPERRIFLPAKNSEVTAQ